MAEPGVIELQNIFFSYENAADPALHDLSLLIEKGEWVWVTGPSGSGKSTLLQLLAGLLTAADDMGAMKGELRVDGVSMSDPDSIKALAGRVGIVFQDPEAGIVQPYVEDELAFGPENLRVHPTEIDQRIETALADVDLAASRHGRTDELSGGQKQRITLASVLTMQPGILLLDEAAASLDEPSAERLMAVLRKLHRQGQTIVFASTRITEAAMDSADRMIVLDQGKIIADGAPRDVLTGHRIHLMQLGVVGNVVTNPFPDSSFAVQIPSTLLEVRGLTYGYPSKASGKRSIESPPILNDVNFTLGAGEFLAVLGANGTGKTTLGKLLAGVLTPPKQRIFLHGNDVTDRKWAGQVGYVFQNPEHQFVADTVLEELVFGLKMKRGLQPWHKTPEDIIRHGFHLLRNSEIDLERYAEQHPYRLNAGAKRMLSVLSTMITEPDVIVLDEPTAGLDYRSAGHIMAACAEFAQQGKAIVMITHDRAIVRRWATKELHLGDS